MPSEASTASLVKFPTKYLHHELEVWEHACSRNELDEYQSAVKWTLGEQHSDRLRTICLVG